MNKKDHLPRLLVLTVVCLLMAAVYTGRLLYLQVSGQDYYSMSERAVYRTRTEVIQAQRGEIFDRNGTPLVTHSEAYNIRLDYATMPRDNESINTLLLDLEEIAARIGESDKVLPPRDSLTVSTSNAGIRFEYPDGFFGTARGRRYSRLVSELNVEDDAGIEDEARAIMLHYGILSADRDPETGIADYYYNYPYDTAAALFLRRLDMTLSEFSKTSPYTIAEDVSLTFLAGIGELYSRGFEIKNETARVYHYPGYLSHILGWIGRIPSDKAEYFADLGYAPDTLVGRDGCEAAFEEYLHGTDGELTITEDVYGTVVKTEVTKEPVAGCDLYLTVDIDMQVVAENALAKNVIRIRAEANPYKALTGEDAYVGALTILDPSDNEIIAIASYPTYNLATLTEDWAYLNSDEHSPMYNRALFGTYAPGSTFKIGVATAALMEKTITKDTVIDAQGQYMYYADTGYTPRCWLYLLTGQVHGKIKVVEAIQESCNYFFFDVGRQLTIEKMNEYCRHYGLGQPTGIEIPEKTGILAGPDYRNENGLNPWGPGDTLQAAIGQSDNLFSPLQISCYISTVLNKGTRYAAHIVKEIRRFDTGEAVFTQKPEILDKIDVSDEILGIVKEGMKGVMDLGSAASVFAGYPIPIGGKTGTAQVSQFKSDNGIITAFAPFDDPEIIVTCVIEQASGGTEAGYSIRDIFDYYFDVDGIRAAEEAKRAEEEARRAAEEAALAEAEAAWLASQGGDEEEEEEPAEPEPEADEPEETPEPEPASNGSDGAGWEIDLPFDPTPYGEPEPEPEPEPEFDYVPSAGQDDGELPFDDGSQWLLP